MFLYRKFLHHFLLIGLLVKTLPSPFMADIKRLSNGAPQRPEVGPRGRRRSVRGQVTPHPS
jgi:hypothetical protein